MTPVLMGRKLKHVWSFRPIDLVPAPATMLVGRKPDHMTGFRPINLVE
jgi:hypothetical protein